MKEIEVLVKSITKEFKNLTNLMNEFEKNYVDENSKKETEKYNSEDSDDNGDVCYFTNLWYSC